MNTVWFSLRRRLLALLLGGVAAAWLVTIVLSFIDAHHEVDELFDAQLVQTAQTLLALAAHDRDRDIEDVGDVAHKYQRRMSYQIWRADGKLMMRSRDVPESANIKDSGFAETRGSDGHWRHFSMWNGEHNLLVQVSENHHMRDELIAHIAWRVLAPALFGLPLIGMLVWFATRHGLSSLNDIARQIAHREPQQLQALIPDSAPEEIRTMLEALNGLFLRVETVLEGERRFTADAAHELRTPLAALQAQLQVALRARDDEERDRSLLQLQSGLTRASHLVEQMLQLARLDPESGLPQVQSIDISALAETVCADLGTQIIDKGIDFELAADSACRVEGNADWLGVLLRNLVDNAIRYTPIGGQIRVTVEPSPDHCCRLTISDSGPGIPADQREAVLQRFHRLNEGNEPGSGLGLAIVTRIADLHGARLLLEDGENSVGLKASVFFRRSDLNGNALA